MTAAAAGIVAQGWDTIHETIPTHWGASMQPDAWSDKGIGVRYQLDPVLVRVVFVVTALVLGGGIALYALAWMCMPLYGKATHWQLLDGNQ